MASSLPPIARCFTVTYPGRLRVVKTQVDIQSQVEAIASELPEKKTYQAIWDTGATGSVITQTVVDELKLKPTGMAVCHGVQGQHNTETFMVKIRLPNGVGFSNVKVTKAILVGDAQVLIGMDIIGLGDFALTHQDGKTFFSFRFPSVEKIDFVHQPPKGMSNPFPSVPPKPVLPVKYAGTPRNALCPCGSGEKYKKCCIDKPA